MHSQVCFAGRSNVGKSSLLNAIMGKDGFASTSLLPGETRAITFYCVQKSLHLVDLPGYGFLPMSLCLCCLIPKVTSISSHIRHQLSATPKEGGGGGVQ